MSDSITVQEATIIYNADFAPSLKVRINNRMKRGIVAFEMQVDPNRNKRRDCDIVLVKYKTTIAPHKTITITKELPKGDYENCNLDFSDITLGDFVLTNGKKTNLQMLFWETATKK